MPGAGASRGRPAWLVLGAWLLGASGCALVPPALHASAVSPPGSPLISRGSHAEPELVTGPSSKSFSASTPEPEPASGPVRHTVVAGETLYRIALRHGVSVEALSAANGLRDARGLVVGQSLVIPGPARPAASRPATSQAPGASSARPGPVGRRPAPTRPEPETKGTLDWPLRGVLYARFGKKGREPHDGIDLAVPAGTPVKAAQAGDVLYAGEQRGYGLIVIIQHTEHLISLYAHNRELRVTTGQKVTRAQVIATVGESGKTSGPQLHFEVRLDGQPVDPLDYLGPLPAS